MVVIDTAAADVVLHESDTISFAGHSFSYTMLPSLVDGMKNGVRISCIYCDESHRFDGQMSVPQTWTATYYLLGQADPGCIGDVDNVADIITNDIMPQYIGEPSTPATYAEIENHIQQRVGDSVSIDFQ